MDNNANFLNMLADSNFDSLTTDFLAESIFGSMTTSDPVATQYTNEQSSFFPLLEPPPSKYV